MPRGGHRDKSDPEMIKLALRMSKNGMLLPSIMAATGLSRAMVFKVTGSVEKRTRHKGVRKFLSKYTPANGG